MFKRSTLLPLIRACAAEVVGTYLLVVFGIGAVAAAVLTGAQSGLWQVAVVWGFGITIAIYVTAAVSGAHLNPAVSLTFAIFRRREFPYTRLLPYWTSQLTGAVLAGLTVLWLYGPFITRFEAENGLVRGAPGSQQSAMVFGEYFPNPAIFGTAEDAWRIVSLPSAFVAEMVGTAMLAFLVATVTHGRNSARPSPAFAAVMIGLGVAAIISVVAPLTQAGLNPARDFGPRLVAFFLGWGETAIPGPRGGWFTVYILAPVVGAVIGGGIYRLVASRLLK